MGRREPVPHQRHRGALALEHAREMRIERALSGAVRPEMTRHEDRAAAASRRCRGQVEIERVRVRVVRDGRAVRETAYAAARGVGRVFAGRTGRVAARPRAAQQSVCGGRSVSWAGTEPRGRTCPCARPARPVNHRHQDTRRRPRDCFFGRATLPSDRKATSRGRAAECRRSRLRTKPVPAQSPKTHAQGGSVRVAEPHAADAQRNPRADRADVRALRPGRDDERRVHEVRESLRARREQVRDARSRRQSLGEGRLGPHHGAHLQQRSAADGRRRAPLPAPHHAAGVLDPARSRATSTR